ncbi:MAG: hypothetical protein K2I42_00745 [Anaeroplasmataceae bacterium]|nr:hypothetical protein [Anaeroplasmataceae bacterium]
MKKIKLFIITILLLTLICSCQKNQYTEINLDSGEVYQIYKTKDKEEVKEIFLMLKDAALNRPNFNGIEIKLNSKAEGNLSIENNEITNVEIKYDLTLDGKSNLKKFLFDGTINIEGYTKSRSPSLSVDAKQKIIGNLKNDTTNLFLNG